MLRAVRGRYSHVGLLCWLSLCFADGLIEIVEEQRCHDYPFRLTCRDLDSHIAILEAWYTATEVYLNLPNITLEPLNLRTENDSELNQVYTFSSPKNNGVFELLNRSNAENASFVNSDYEFRLVNESVNDTVEMGTNETGCGVRTYAKSYASWRDGRKGRKEVSREKSINLRAPLSYRCTGVNHCSFILSEDYPPSVSWPVGNVFIKYACFDDTLSLHYCNREVHVSASGPDSEGYIRTPGYPHFYVGEECRWKISASPEQKIRVSLMDVSLRSIGPFETDCKDYVSITDSNGDSLLSSCDQVELPYLVTSSTNAIEVAVEARSQGAFPKRGVLLHYKSIGCVTLKAPSSSYIVYRNEDVAHYMCHEKHVFNDTRQRARVIWCFDDNRWNDTVPACVEESTVDAVGNYLPKSNQTDGKITHNEANMVVDIVIPSLLIAALFIGNAFVVLIIYKYRKRKCEDYEDEFNTIPLSGNGNIHSAGNAV